MLSSVVVKCMLIAILIKVIVDEEAFMPQLTPVYRVTHKSNARS